MGESNTLLVRRCLGFILIGIMPKIKTKSGAKKRFKVTGSGRIKREKAFQAHILTSKSKKRKRNLRHATLVASTDERTIKIMLGR